MTLAQTTLLDRGWTLSVGACPTDSPARDLPGTIPATVPGVVHTDLLAADLIANPYLDNMEEELQWIGRCEWVYSTEFATPESTNRHTLIFDGLDTVATVSLNGVEILRSFNQHRKYEIDVSSLLRNSHDAQNRLEVRFRSAWDYAHEQKEALGERPNAYPTPFNYMRKMAANFGWDWGPQLVTAGIWRPVRLVSWDVARIQDARVVTTVSGDFGRVAVELDVEVVPELASDLVATLAIDGNEVSAHVRDGVVRLEAHIDEPRLWWPTGMGNQELYDLQIHLNEVAGTHASTGPDSPDNDENELDALTKRVGLRTVELDTREDEEGRAFTFVVNGQPVFIRGANWIPDDAFPSRITRDQYRDSVSLAVDANMNMLRVWGGGIYEADDFYDACDELGVMVWQDFLFACAAYPEEQPLWDEVAAEASDNIIRISSHPSLVLWNGCNENIWGWYDWDWQEPLGERTWGLGYYTELLPRLVAELAPHVPYSAGSPYSGDPLIHANDPARGTMHIWDAWNRADYTVYAAYRPRFVAEFGYQGPPTWSTLTTWVHDEPLTEDSPNMLVHQKAIDGVGKIRRGMAPHFTDPRSFEDWHYIASLQQARAVEFGIRHFRALRPHCMGAIVWQLNDCWPVVSWAAVDGDGGRKPLWHALKRVYADRLVHIELSTTSTALALINDGQSDWHETFKVSRVDGHGRVLGEVSLEAGAEAGSAHRVILPASVANPFDATTELLIVRGEDGNLLRAWTWVEERDLALPAARVELSLSDWSAGRQTITVTSDQVVRGLTIFADRVEVGAWVDDTDITLIPGSPVTVVLYSHREVTREELFDRGAVRWLNEEPVLRRTGTA